MLKIVSSLETSLVPTPLSERGVGTRLPGDYKDEFSKPLLKAPVATRYNHCSPLCVCVCGV